MAKPQHESRSSRKGQTQTPLNPANRYPDAQYCARRDDNAYTPPFHLSHQRGQASDQACDTPRDTRPALQHQTKLPGSTVCRVLPDVL